MSKEKRRVPKLRFPGFTEDWEQRKADYIFKSVTDKGYPELPVLSASQELGMVYRDQNGIDIQHDKKNEASYKRVLPGQFVIHLRSFQGGFAYSEIEGITSPAYTVINFKNSNEQYGLFWKHVFKSETFIKRLETITYGIRDGRSISFSDFKSLILWYPSFSEQKLIGDSLAVVEKGITLHQRKLEHLNLKKKALLQKLFPKNGERYPELRFPGFTDAWEQCKLEDICSYQSSSLTINDIDENGQYDLYDANSLIGKTNKGYMEIEYITIIKDGAGVGRTRMLPKNTMFLGTMGALTPKNSSLGFLYQLVTSANLGKICTGSTIPHIYFKDYGKLKFYIPSIIEQEVIGKFFNNIDYLVTLHQQEPFLCGNSVNGGVELC